MGWIFSIAMFIFYCIFNNDYALIASGLFAIAGSVSFASSTICGWIDKATSKIVQKSIETITFSKETFTDED